MTPDVAPEATLQAPASEDKLSWGSMLRLSSNVSTKIRVTV